MKEALKVAVPEDAEKYSLDFPSLYKKYEIAAKAEQAKSFAQSQVNKLVYNVVSKIILIIMVFIRKYGFQHFISYFS